MTEKYPLLSPLADDFLLERGRHAVLLIHGFTGSPTHMRPLGEALAEAGYTVRGLRLKGHGTDIWDMLACSAEDWLSDARNAYHELRQRYDSVAVGGLSMGGCLALILAEEEEGVRACVSLSAPMSTANPFSHLGLVLSPFMKTIPKHEAEERALLDQAYDIGYSEMPVRQCHDLNVLIARAKKGLSKIQCPLLCVQSQADRAIGPESAALILARASSPRKDHLTLQTSPHVVTIGPEKERVITGVTDFFNSL